MKSYLFKIRPVPKPRMTRADAWKKRSCVVNYFAYKDKLRKLIEKCNFKLSESSGCYYFHIKMPDSWSKKKKEKFANKPHQQRPDLDNLLKGFWDAVLDEDCRIWKILHAQKTWDYEDSIEIIQIE